MQPLEIVQNLHPHLRLHNPQQEIETFQCTPAGKTL
jgi:hypothetical protein